MNLLHFIFLWVTINSNFYKTQNTANKLSTQKNMKTQGKNKRKRLLLKRKATFIQNWTDCHGNSSKFGRYSLVTSMWTQSFFHVDLLTKVTSYLFRWLPPHWIGSRRIGPSHLSCAMCSMRFHHWRLCKLWGTTGKHTTAQSTILDSRPEIQSFSEEKQNTIGFWQFSYVSRIFSGPFLSNCFF